MIRSQKKTLLRGLLSCFLVAIMLFTSLAAYPISASAAAKPSISKSSQNIVIGGKYNLDIKNKVKGSTYTWKSSNEKVAKVDNRGIVTGIKKGTATITCVIKAGKANYEVSSKITVRVPADEFEINNKVTALNVGQVYDLNRTLTPKKSNDLTTWKSSNTKIANPDSKGKFTALRTGTVTITGTTISKATDKVVIKVVDRLGLVSTLAELEELLGSGAGLITLRTDEEITITIPQGDYSNQKLVVEAPKATITNKGVFKSVDIVQIKDNSWIEETEGNVLNVTTSGRIVVGKDASATINVSKGNNVTIENNGTIKEVVVSGASKVTFTGTSKQVVPVVVDNKDAKITTSVPLSLTLNTKVTLVINAGAEGTVIYVANKDLIPTITGTGTVKVKIGTGTNVTEESIVATPIISGGGSTGGGGGGGGGYVPTPTPTPTPTPSGSETLVGTVDGNSKVYKLTKGTLADVESVTVNYAGVPIPVSSELVSKLRDYLNAEATTVARWNNIVSMVETVTGLQAKVTGTKGDSTKTVEFSQGFLSGLTYKVTVSGNSVTVETQAGNPYELTKTGEDTLTITNAPADLSFVINY